MKTAPRLTLAAVSFTLALSGCSYLPWYRPAPAPAPAPPAPQAPATPAPPEIPCPRPEAEGLDGWVLLSVRVRADGTVAAAKVVRSHPRGRFEDEAIDRVSKARFHPKIVGGHPVEQEGLQCIEFERDSI